MLGPEVTASRRISDELLRALDEARAAGRWVLGLFPRGSGGYGLLTWTSTTGFVEHDLGRGPFRRPSRHGFPSWWGWEFQSSDAWMESPPVVRAGGVGTHVMPLGPVRADVAECLRYEMTVFGDEIHHVRLLSGFKHRHVEDLMAGRSWREGVLVAERITGTSPVAHALAYSLAVEQALGWTLPPSVERYRLVLAELERVTSHVGDLATLAASTGTIAAAADLYRLKELILRLNFALTGHRYLRGVIVPGGIRVPPARSAATVEAVLADFEREWSHVRRSLERTASFLDRLYGAGRLSSEAVHHLDLTGFVGRSAGISRDVRFDAPYARYPEVTERRHAVVLDQPDAYGRYRVRMEEIGESLAMIRRVRLTPIGGGVDASRGHGPGRPVGYGMVEAPRGRLVYRVELSGDRLQRVGVRTPSALNWAAVPLALTQQNIMQDFPIIEASFGLAVSALDL
jgi:formate hydrogenlyase subunit 5